MTASQYSGEANEATSVDVEAVGACAVFGWPGFGAPYLLRTAAAAGNAAQGEQEQFRVRLRL